MTAKPPLQAIIVPVTPLQQNCTLIWCTKTMRGAFTDPGGDLDRLKQVAADNIYEYNVKNKQTRQVGQTKDAVLALHA